MKLLSGMPNIGKTLEQKLNEVGINTPEELMEKGSIEAFMLIKKKDKTACLNMLYALEGAVRDIRWHNLPSPTKEELKKIYLSL